MAAAGLAYALLSANTFFGCTFLCPRRGYSTLSPLENSMFLTLKQRHAYDTVAAALPFPLDATKVSVAPGISYVKSPVKAHDYAAGVMAAFGSVVEHLGAVRGLPSQTLKLDRRRCGLLLNSLQLLFQNGYSTIMDTWGVNPDNGTYRTKDGRHVTMIGLHPHLRDRLLVALDCVNTAQAIQAAVEKKTAQELEDEAIAKHLPLGIVRTPAEWAAHPLGAEVLKQIWTLADFTKRGMLDADEFAVAMYLVEAVQGGMVIPDRLPTALIPPSKRHLVPHALHA